MKEEVLLQAIGGLDESILAESEEAIATPKRILWRVVVAAATIAMLTIGVAAAVMQFIPPQGDPQIDITEYSWQTYMMDENGGLTDQVHREDTAPIFRVRMAFPTNDDATLDLKTIYMIQVPEHWVLASRLTNESLLEDGTQTLSQFSVSWEPYADADGVISGLAAETLEDYVTFQQYTAYYYNMDIGAENRLESFHAIPSWVELSSELLTLADIPVLKVTIPEFELTAFDKHSLNALAYYMDKGEVHLYWSDGDSIMSLTYPAWITDEEIEEILSTIHAVEDPEALLAEINGTD